MKNALFVVVMMLVGTSALAQQPTPTPVITIPCTITVLTEEDTSTGLVVTFRTLRDRLVVPVPDSTPASFDCRATPEEVAFLETSPSVDLNEPLPLSENDAAIVEGLPGYGIVNTSFANLRSGPSAEFTKVGLLSGGDVLVVLGRNRTTTWWYVQAGTLNGWVLGSLLALRGDLTDVPLVETPGEISPAVLYIPWTGNPLYDGLQAASVEICQIQGDQVYRIQGISFNDAWYFITATCLDGTEADGWISAARGVVRNPADVFIPTLRG